MNRVGGKSYRIERKEENIKNGRRGGRKKR